MPKRFPPSHRRQHNAVQACIQCKGHRGETGYGFPEKTMNSSVHSEKESLSCRCCSEACRQISHSFGSKKHIEERGETK